VVDEERMRSGHWLGSLLRVPFSGLTLMVGWQEEHLYREKASFHLIPRGSLPEKMEEKDPSGTSGSRFTWKNGH